jgi:hypothetical protein
VILRCLLRRISLIVVRALELDTTAILQQINLVQDTGLVRRGSMSDLKLPVALVAAMAIQLVAAVWWVSKQAHTIEVLQQDVVDMKTYINSMDIDLEALIQFATFTENRWAEDYSSDMTYERVFGTKEPTVE